MDYRLITLVLTSFILSGVHSVTLQKNQDPLTINQGETYDLLCTADTEVRACTIRTPLGKTHVMWSGASYENGRITKKGEDGKGQCGITVNNAMDTDNGKWECIISAQAAEGSVSVSGFVDVVVAVPPTIVQLKIGENRAPAEYSVKMDKPATELSIDCIAEQTRPQPEFEWFLGEERLNADITKREANNKGGKKDYVETLKYYPDAKHNGKTLRCSIVHQAYTQAAKEAHENEADVLLKILYPPVASKKAQTHYGLALGGSNIIQMAFSANPKPSSGHWTVGNGTTVPLGAKSLDSKYESGSIESKDETKGEWLVQLTIDDLQEADTIGTHKLTVKNEEGETIYLFNLKTGDQPPQESSKSLTVGIIVIIVIIVLILVIVIVARAKGMMCFAAAKGGDDLDEEKEAFENVEKGESNAIVQDPKQPIVSAAGDSNSNKGTPNKTENVKETEAKAEAEEKKSNGAHTPV